MEKTSSGGHCARSLTHCPKMGYSNYVTEALPDLEVVQVGVILRAGLSNKCS